MDSLSAELHKLEDIHWICPSMHCSEEVCPTQHSCLQSLTLKVKLKPYFIYKTHMLDSKSKKYIHLLQLKVVEIWYDFNSKKLHYLFLMCLKEYSYAHQEDCIYLIQDSKTVIL